MLYGTPFSVALGYLGLCLTVWRIRLSVGGWGWSFSEYYCEEDSSPLPYVVIMEVKKQEKF
jgi:hypothetical protein